MISRLFRSVLKLFSMGKVRIHLVSICLLKSPIVQVVLRQTIAKLTNPESQNEQEMKTIILLKQLLQLLELAQCHIWNMCAFLQPNEIVVDLSSTLIHRKVCTIY